ncbi:hypothetical protein [Ramlibacter tataouinensis]|uniref:Candidate membrane protein n=1 Tax=Ramlibacter tataouinensis (strain ATCC BAA-407 / DSM 14655 / LMG 21543 / TTB310) TaxID=365046 RepID=F5Y4T1_RAMTT|nr:hypothetical protein [Ramlibacter tataouinensis]AEG92587.1 candidate membrane protein [Ramlibacter tataouinensis TTB310]
MLPLESLLIWPDRLLLSVAFLFLIGMPFLYMARKPVHELIRGAARSVSNPLKLSARWLSKTAQRLHHRNREVLFAQAAHEVGKGVERDLERVSALVQRDLEGYPALQRKLMDQITQIEEDYKKSGEVPPPPPEWVNAVEAIAKIKPSSDGMVQRILGEIRKALDDIYAKVIAEYRGTAKERHRILNGFLPFWRSVSQTLTQVNGNITSLKDSAARIDANVLKLDKIHARGKDITHALTTSAATQFFVSGLIMLIAVGGAYINYKLIALPMAAMVGGGDYIAGNMQASELAALVIILFEALMGLFLMEMLHFTRLLPLGNLTEKMRRRLMWASLTVLLVLAGFEVALAVMRDEIIAAGMALKQQLSAAAGAGAAAAPAEASWVMRIPTIGQMVLGFTLPFALAFVAIPLEHFVNTGRTVLGALLDMVMHALAFALRFLAIAVKELGRFTIMLYDVLIFAPLAVERWVAGHRGAGPRMSQLSPASAFGELPSGKTR